MGAATLSTPEDNLSQDFFLPPSSYILSAYLQRLPEPWSGDTDAMCHLGLSTQQAPILSTKTSDESPN